ncbi:MAG: RHS repeat-associated core domain-containing protein [Nitrosomonas sp.]|nr:RHS repeat-associated core domain-containing protein [Nitrosomonas sp.]
MLSTLPGQYFDKETNLHYNHFRYYEPETGRYISPDPIGLAGGVNVWGMWEEIRLQVSILMDWI